MTKTLALSSVEKCLQVTQKYVFFHFLLPAEGLLARAFKNLAKVSTLWCSSKYFLLQGCWQRNWHFVFHSCQIGLYDKISYALFSGGIKGRFDWFFHWTQWGERGRNHEIVGHFCCNEMQKRNVYCSEIFIKFSYNWLKPFIFNATSLPVTDHSSEILHQFILHPLHGVCKKSLSGVRNLCKRVLLIFWGFQYV